MKNDNKMFCFPANHTDYRRTKFVKFCDNYRDTGGLLINS